MAKQRYISTSIWDDDWFVEELNRDEKLFYFYLLTNEHTNIAGIYKISLRRITIETNFTKTQVLEIFKSLEKSKKVYYFQEHVIMTNWPKHQNWQKSERIHKGIRAILIKDVPQDIIERISKGTIPYRYPIDTLSKGIGEVSIPYTYPSNYNDKDLDLNSDSDSDLDPDIIIKSKSTKLNFKKPEKKEFEEYCKEINFSCDYHKFYDYYQSKNWLIGTSKMKDWKAAVRNWQRKDVEKKPHLRKAVESEIIKGCKSCGSSDMEKKLHNLIVCKSCGAFHNLKNGKWVLEVEEAIQQDDTILGF